MSMYEIPSEYAYRIHHCRPRFKDNVEDVLIYIASEITRIGGEEKSDFRTALNNSIRMFPGNSDLADKTINNWRTEISSLFGLYYDDGNITHAGRRAAELSENSDLVMFFKYFCYFFQYPGAHIKAHEVVDQINNGIHFKPAQYFLKVLLAAEADVKKTGYKGEQYLTKAEACYCVLNDLRCTRDNEAPEKTWERIFWNRHHNVQYEQIGDVVRYAGDILDYMEHANLLRTYNGRDFFLNHGEDAAIQKFVNSNEWYGGYDSMIQRRAGNMIAVKNAVVGWFEYVNQDIADTDFSTDITAYIAEGMDIDAESDSHALAVQNFINKLRTAQETFITKEVGDVGETLTIEHERNTLKEGGREDLAHLVQKIPTETAAGYDISSRELDDSLKMIEVKTTISTKSIQLHSIHMTTNEWTVASGLKDLYYIYRIMISKTDIKLFVMRNPVQLYKDDLISMVPKDGADIKFTEKAGHYEELRVCMN